MKFFYCTVKWWYDEEGKEVTEELITAGNSYGEAADNISHYYGNLLTGMSLEACEEDCYIMRSDLDPYERTGYTS